MATINLSVPPRNRRESRPTRDERPRAPARDQRVPERTLKEPERRTAPGKKKYELTQAERTAFEEFGIESFQTEYARLRKLTMEDDFSTSKASYALLRAQMATVIRALNVMDKAFKESAGRNAYSYVAMHGLARELSHDLRAFGDQTELAERVRRDVVQGVLQGLATEVVSALIKTRHSLQTKLGPNSGKVVDAALESYQKQLQATFVDGDARAAELIKSTLSVR